MVMAAKGPASQLILPPGFRFHPTDEELVLHYLGPKAEAYVFSLPVIADVDLYKHDPWDLPGMYPPDKAIFGEREWYFFSPRDRKYPNGARPNRAAGSGYWKATGTDKPIYRTKDVKTPIKIGVKKALVFYKGRAPKGVKTNWIMHEYRLAENGISPTHHVHRKGSLRLDDWVLCRIYKKSTNAQRTGKERESSSCVEEVLASLPEIDNPRIMLPRLEQTFSGLMDQDLQTIQNMSSPLMDSFLTGDGSEIGSPNPPEQVESPPDARSSVLQQQGGPGTGLQPKIEPMTHDRVNMNAEQQHPLNHSALVAELGANNNGGHNAWRPNQMHTNKEFMQMMSSELFLDNHLRQSPPELLDMEDEAQSSYRASLASSVNFASGGALNRLHHHTTTNNNASTISSFAPAPYLDLQHRSHHDDGTLGSIHAHFTSAGPGNLLSMSMGANVGAMGTSSGTAAAYLPSLNHFQTQQQHNMNLGRPTAAPVYFDLPHSSNLNHELTAGRGR
ncbi:hypothetical protein Mapa_003566 [Marchantia paleacea]|nr:hypothetical protein Mapa_003566 [Marchantia paleacea]